MHVLKLIELYTQKKKKKGILLFLNFENSGQNLKRRQVAIRHLAPAWLVLNHLPKQGH